MKHILLIGSYGRGNIGDDAFLLATMRLFKGYHITINAADAAMLPATVRAQVSTIPTQFGRNFWHKLAVFRRSSHIVYCGGDVWVELYGERYPRQSLYKMVILNLAARLLGKKVHYMGCGIGKLRGYSLWLARFSARLAHGVVVRETRTAHILGLRKARVLPDLATTLPIAVAPARSARANGKFTIGISMLYYLPNPEQSFPRFVDILREFIQQLPPDQYRIVLFPMLASPHEDHDDVWASAKLREQLPGVDISINTDREVGEYVAALSQVDLLIGVRLHANILAMMAGVPCLGISYRPKVTEFFRMSGLEKYCIDLEDLSTALLGERFKAIAANHDTARQEFIVARNQVIQQAKGYRSFAQEYL